MLEGKVNSIFTGCEHPELRCLYVRSVQRRGAADPVFELQHEPESGGTAAAEEACAQDPAVLPPGREAEVPADLLQQQRRDHGYPFKTPSI